MPNEYNPQQCGNSKRLRNKMLMYSALHSDMQQFIRERYWCYEPIGTLGQNLPSNSTYGKLIKSCVQAPEGWLFVGLDFSSLEDRISALTTKDPNKLKVYLEGYDGHCLRTASYSSEQMPEVTAARDEIAKPGQTYKVTYSDGSVEFFNENNPLLKELRNAIEGNIIMSEQGRKIQLAARGALNSESLSQKINQFTMTGLFIREWDSMIEAAKTLGINQGNISNACLGRCKSAGGFKWQKQ